ncbi:MAG: BamA/TamA family outer membrane protein [Silvanigrellales bacterium]|nr:BamA/TamA family outer membrane protein [Silvanigrellales bacterium]
MIAPRLLLVVHGLLRCLLAFTFYSARAKAQSLPQANPPSYRAPLSQIPDVKQPEMRPDLGPEVGPGFLGEGLLLSPPLSAFAGRTIAAVRVEGLGRTDLSVVERELLFAPGQTVVERDIARSLQRLKNLRIFRDARARVEPAPDGSAVIVVTVEEKWTVIPVARFGGGGGSAFFVIGAYDLNLLGRYLEAGAQYENFNGIHGGVLWFRDPRLLGARQKLSLDAGTQGRTRVVYQGADSETVGAYVHRKRRVAAAVDREIFSWVTLGVGGEVVQDAFGTNTLTLEESRANQRNAFELPTSARTVLVQGRATFGGLNLDDYLVSGFQADVRLDLAKPLLRSQRDYHRVSIQGLAFGLLPFQQNLGARVGAGTTDALELPDRFFLGGLEHVRGYRDGEFVGRKIWYLNAEYRVPSLRTRLVVLQHVVFFDTGDAAQEWSRFRFVHSSTPRSAGAGLRFIVPPVARFNVRLDYAFALTRSKGRGIVFGMQQFF